MTQRDEGHDYRDSKNKSEAYERKKETEVILKDFKEGVIHGFDFGYQKQVDKPENILISGDDYYKQGYKFGLKLYCNQE
tara:strand:- start:602 stop:838 length:237 start_codon:yes stop_codon:yes gene_type:complete